MNFSDKLFISNLITSAANKQRKIAKMTRQRKRMQMAARMLTVVYNVDIDDPAQPKMHLNNMHHRNEEQGYWRWVDACTKCYRVAHEGECRE